MSQLFSKPHIPVPQLPPPPTPVRDTPMEARLSDLGRRQGLLAAMFGLKNPSTSSSNTGKAQLTGQ